LVRSAGHELGTAASEGSICDEPGKVFGRVVDRTRERLQATNQGKCLEESWIEPGKDFRNVKKRESNQGKTLLNLGKSLESALLE